MITRTQLSNNRLSWTLSRLGNSWWDLKQIHNFLHKKNGVVNPSAPEAGLLVAHYGETDCVNMYVLLYCR